MSSTSAFLVSSLFLSLVQSNVQASQETIQKFRLWLGGKEVGTHEIRISSDSKGRHYRSRQVMSLERMGTPIQSESKQEGQRLADGSMSFKYQVSLASMPLEGTGSWSPAHPKRLVVQPKNGSEMQEILPAGALLWPEDVELQLKEAARFQKAVSIQTFSFEGQAWSRLELQPDGSDALPGFPDTVRFKGTQTLGQAKTPVTFWISPTHGELKEQSQIAGMESLMQRAELPPPGTHEEGRQDVILSTIRTLPHHPFLPWIPEVKLRWKGKSQPDIPEDEQQKRLAPFRYQFRRASLPTGEDARQMPVKGPASPEEASYLAATPIVPFNDPIFSSLMARLGLKGTESRWEAAQKINRFVFDWIVQKDFSVGFASAQEVARNSKGDCTEHGVLAVALLRKAGIPARAVAGWAPAGEILAMHYWVEIKIGSRWIPLDPTFNQAPAGAVRIKMGTSDLSSLASVAWEGLDRSLGEGQWIPEGDWAGSIRISGDAADRLHGPDGSILRALRGGAWQMDKGKLFLTGIGYWPLSACTTPTAAELDNARKFMAKGLTAWFRPPDSTQRKPSCTYLQLSEDRWLLLHYLREPEVSSLLMSIEFQEAP